MGPPQVHSSASASPLPCRRVGPVSNPLGHAGQPTGASYGASALGCAPQGSAMLALATAALQWPPRRQSSAMGLGGAPPSCTPMLAPSVSRQTSVERTPSCGPPPSAALSAGQVNAQVSCSPAGSPALGPAQSVAAVAAGLAAAAEAYTPLAHIACSSAFTDTEAAKRSRSMSTEPAQQRHQSQGVPRLNVPTPSYGSFTPQPSRGQPSSHAHGVVQLWTPRTQQRGGGRDAGLLATGHHPRRGSSGQSRDISTERGPPPPSSLGSTAIGRSPSASLSTSPRSFSQVGLHPSSAGAGAATLIPKLSAWRC